MLIISNEDIESVLTLDVAFKALERAYLDQASGRAVNRPRSDLYLPGVHDGSIYAFKSMEGGLVESKVVALRLNSDVIRWEDREKRVIKQKVPAAPGKKWVGLIQLFSAETGEPLAIFPDGVIQRIRVAVTSALAAREMARKDASVLAVFGSGWQAGAHIPAFCAVRDIKKVNVFSPTKDNREEFAQKMEQLVGIPVVPMPSSEAAAKDADILVAATNAITPVISAAWLRSGVHATCVKDCEFDDETLRRADRIVIHSRNFAPENYIAGCGDRKISAHDPVDFIRGNKSTAVGDASPFWIDSPELKDVIAGSVPGRTSPEEATCFINNIGLGIQFAAVGHAVYLQAKAKGLGKEIPTDWFLESVHP